MRKVIRKECKNKEGEYCKYLDTDDGEAYCIYSVVECNPTFLNYDNKENHNGI